MSSPVRPRAPGVDELLQDYLRVINEKDSEILDLVSKVQSYETELRKVEERAKARVRGLKDSAAELQTEAESAVRRLTDAEALVGSLQKERDELRQDVIQLRDAMYRQDHDLRAALRSSEKGQKESSAAVQDLQAELDARTRDAKESIGSLEGRLATATRGQRDSEDERSRLMKECAALQSRLEDRENQLREMRRQKKTLVSKEEAQNEIRALEARANSEVSAAMRELERLRAEHTEEHNRGQRRDAALGEAREEVRRLEQQLNDARRHIHEAEMKAAQAQVGSAQRVEELRADVAVAHDKISTLETHKSQAEQERAQLSIRYEENKRLHQNTEVSLRAELDRTRDKMLEHASEIESLKRVVAQQDTIVQQTRDRAERIQEERAVEVRGLREDVNRFSMSAQSLQATAANHERTISTLREELRRESEARGAAEKHNRELGANLSQARHGLDLQANELNAAASNVAELRREREEHQVRYQRVENSLRDAHEEIRAHKINAERLTQELHRLETAVATDRAERNRLEGRASADRLTIERLQSDLAERESRLSALEGTYTTADAQRHAAIEDAGRLRSQLELMLGEHRRETQADRDAIRRLQMELEDMQTRLSSADLNRDELAKELTERRSKEAQLQSLLQSRAHELQAAKERADGADVLKQQLERQNAQLQKQGQELQARVDELRQSYDTLQTCFDRQQVQLEATSRARGEAIASTNPAASVGATSPVPGARMAGPATPLGGSRTPGAVAGAGDGNVSVLPARGPSIYSTSQRGPFSPGMYSSVIAGPGLASSPARNYHYSSGVQASNLSPTRHHY